MIINIIWWLRTEPFTRGRRVWACAYIQLVPTPECWWQQSYSLIANDIVDVFFSSLSVFALTRYSKSLCYAIIPSWGEQRQANSDHMCSITTDRYKIAFRGNNSNLGMCPDPLSQWKESGSKTSDWCLEYGEWPWSPFGNKTDWLTARRLGSPYNKDGEG